jgi:hypothetical protein
VRLRIKLSYNNVHGLEVKNQVYNEDLKWVLPLAVLSSLKYVKESEVQQ